MLKSRDSRFLFLLEDLFNKHFLTHVLKADGIGNFTVKRYEFFNHTADIGIRIFGNSLAALFENAGLALFDIITDISKVRDCEIRQIHISRESVDELLVEWLSRLLYLHATELLLGNSFQIQTITEQRLQGEVRGEIFQENRHVIKTEVKAITYHGLAVYYEHGLWNATIVIDV